MSLQCHGGQALSSFKLNIFGSTGSKQGPSLAKFKKPSGSVRRHSDIVWSKEEVAKNGTFALDTRQYNNILIHLQNDSEGCCGSTERIGETSYNFLPEVESPTGKSGGTIDIKCKFYS